MNKRENTIKATEEKVRQTQVANAMDKLARAVDDQLLVIENLEKRLQSVLSANQKVTEGSVEKAEELVPLATMVNGLACRLKVQNQRLSDLIDRLEV